MINYYIKLCEIKDFVLEYFAKKAVRISSTLSQSPERLALYFLYSVFSCIFFLPVRRSCAQLSWNWWDIRSLLESPRQQSRRECVRRICEFINTELE